MIKFGKITSPVRNLITEINDTIKMKFDYVELGIEPFNDNLYIERNLKSIKKLLNKFRYTAISHTAWWYDLSSPYNNVRNAWIGQACNDMKISKKLGCKLINFHFMVHSSILLKYKNSRKAILDNYVRSLKYLCHYAEKNGLRIMLENGEEKFEDYKYILDRVPKLNVHFDVGHAFISGKMKNIKKFFSYFEERIAHIHIHDNHGKQDEHLPLRKGNINWKNVAFLINKYNYNKTITLEVFTSSKDLLKSKKYIQSLLN